MGYASSRRTVSPWSLAIGEQEGYAEVPYRFGQLECAVEQLDRAASGLPPLFQADEEARVVVGSRNLKQPPRPPPKSVLN